MPKLALRWFAGVLVLALAVGLTGCNLPVGTPTELPETIAYRTVEVQLTRVAETLPTATVEPPPILATFTQAPSFTPPATITSAPSITPTIAVPCDRAQFVTDVTIPDGTDFAPGATFTKTWRLRNNGTCTWTSGYALVFDSGVALGGPASQQLTTGTVAPGQTIDVSVNLTAPAAVGTYRGNWRLRNASGAVFGIGPAGNLPFWVEVEVPPPAATTVVPANFVVTFENTHICQTTLAYATFRVGNSGGYGFEHANITINDLTTPAQLYTGTSNSPFMGTANDCPPGASSMGPGSTYFIAVSIGSPPPSGHNARLTLRLCTQDSGAGTCVDKTVDFAIP